MIQSTRDDRVRTLENTVDDELLTLDEVADIFRCSKWTVRRRAIDTGLLKPTMYMGRTPLYSRADVVKFIADRARERRFAATPIPPKRRRRRK